MKFQSLLSQDIISDHANDHKYANLNATQFSSPPILPIDSSAFFLSSIQDADTILFQYTNYHYFKPQLFTFKTISPWISCFSCQFCIVHRKIYEIKNYKIETLLCLCNYVELSTSIVVLVLAIILCNYWNASSSI